MIFIVNCLLMIHMEYYALFFLNEISSKLYFPAAIFFPSAAVFNSQTNLKCFM